MNFFKASKKSVVILNTFHFARFQKKSFKKNTNTPLFLLVLAYWSTEINHTSCISSPVEDKKVTGQVKNLSKCRQAGQFFFQNFTEQGKILKTVTGQVHMANFTGELIQDVTMFENHFALQELLFMYFHCFPNLLRRFFVWNSVCWDNKDCAKMV